MSAEARRLVVVALAVTLLLGAAVPDALARPAESPAVSPVAKKHKKKKRKAVKCKKNQVPIKVNRRVVGCRSLGAAVPPPHAGDSRLGLTQLALGDGLKGLRDRRGRKPQSLRKIFRKVDPNAWAAVQQAIPEGFARVDQLAAASPNAYSRTASGRARTIPLCAQPGAPPPPTTEGKPFTSSKGGTTVTGTATLGPVATIGMGFEGHDYTVNLQISTDLCDRYNPPECPTAAGLIDGTDSSLFRISLSIAKGGEVLVTRSFAFEGHTRLHAEVDEDAKLDFVDIDDTQTAHIELGGSKQDFGPVSLVYTGLHHARVQMPGGAIVPDQSVVDIAVTAKGVTVGRSDLGAAATSIQKDLDEKFAVLAARELDHFTFDEAAWKEANKCVDVQFNPAKIKLHRGDHGSVGVQAVAKQGGGAAPGHWSKIAQDNATFSPDKAEGASPQFSYDVTKAGKDVIVKGTWRATTRAGVAQGDWSQETDEAPLYLGEVQGTLHWDSNPSDIGCQVHEQINNYSAKERSLYSPYGPFSAFNGFIASYDEAGSATVTDDPCGADDPGCSYSVTPDPQRDEGYVQLYATGNDPDANYFEVWTSGWASASGVCGGDEPVDQGSWMIGVGRMPLSEIGKETITIPISRNDHDDFDGTFVGSGTLTLHRVN